MSLDALFRQLDPARSPPLEQWDPPFCGDMDLRITADGEWIHEGAAIRRPALIQLLASVMRRESDGDYYLVTPGEKLRIRVDDLPLVVSDADAEESESGVGWNLVTTTGERIRLDAEHRLHLTPGANGDLLPALPVRHRLEARLHRNLFYRLVDLAEQRGNEIGLVSDRLWHPLGRLDDGAA